MAFTQSLKLMIRNWLLFFFLIISGCKTGVSPIPTYDISPEKILYKEIDDVKLYLYLYKPKNYEQASNLNAAVFFFGGGWVGGSHTQFNKQATYLAQRGLVCFTLDYRIYNEHETNPISAIEDAKSAMRFIRANAQKFKINPTMIAAGGGSAGGHLAAATATIKTINEPLDDLTINPSANLLLLFNPVFDNGPEGYQGRFQDLFKKSYQELSPIHNITSDLPPTLVMLGTKDDLIPVATAEKYEALMNDAGVECKLVLYEDQSHGFFNANRSIKSKNISQHFFDTLQETDDFLVKFNYLKPSGKTVESYFK